MAVRCSVCSGSKSCGTNFATTCFRPRSCFKIPGTAVFGIPRSASGAHTVRHRSLWMAAHTHSTFSGALLVTGLPDHSTDSHPSLKCLCPTFICGALIAERGERRRCCQRGWDRGRRQWRLAVLTGRRYFCPRKTDAQPYKLSLEDAFKSGRPQMDPQGSCSWHL